MLANDETRDFARSLRRALTLPEGLLWRALKRRKLAGLRFRRQHPVGPYVLDFYCARLRLAVEVDGGSHGFGRQAEKDAFRDRWLAAKGIVTLRLSARCVLEDVDDATGTILGFIEQAGLRPREPGNEGEV
jgi:very-short-patch-repair endonuclease